MVIDDPRYLLLNIGGEYSCIVVLDEADNPEVFADGLGQFIERVVFWDDLEVAVEDPLYIEITLKGDFKFILVIDSCIPFENSLKALRDAVKVSFDFNIYDIKKGETL